MTITIKLEVLTLLLLTSQFYVVEEVSEEDLQTLTTEYFTR